MRPGTIHILAGLVFLLGARALAQGTPASTGWKIRNTIKTGETDGAVALSHDGKALVHSASTIKLWDTATGKDVAAFESRRSWSAFLGFAADGKALVAREDGRATPGLALAEKPELTILDMAIGKPQGKLHLPEQFSLLLRGPDGKMFATTSAKPGTVKLWDATGKQLRVLLPPAGFVYALVFSPDGKLLAAGTREGNPKSFRDVDLRGHVKVWDVATGDVLLSETEPQGVRALAFGPDNKTLAAGSALVKLWDVARGGQPTLLQPTPPAPDGPLTFALVFAPDGKTLAAAWRPLRERDAAAGGVLLWDVPSRKHLALPKGHAGVVRTVAFSGDGSTAASLDQGGDVIVWQTRP